MVPIVTSFHDYWRHPFSIFKLRVFFLDLNRAPYYNIVAIELIALLEDNLVGLVNSLIGGYIQQLLPDLGRILDEESQPVAPLEVSLSNSLYEVVVQPCFDYILHSGAFDPLSQVR